MNEALTKTHESQIAQFGEMSVAAVVDRKKKIQEVLKAVMIEGEHFGKIPGCGDKPTLYKSGAEVLAVTFGLAPRFKIVRTDLPGGHREYEVTCTLVHIASGSEVGDGVGSCSTMESKYRWRGGGRTCPECGAAAIKKSKYDSGGWYCHDKSGGCGRQWKAGDPAIEKQPSGRAENPDIADTYNTVLKMAKKRAQVDATLTAVGASDVLAQDLEDLEEVARDLPRDVPPPIDVEAREQRQAAPRDAKPWKVDLAQCKSAAEVRALAPKFNAIPKGSPMRAEAMADYKARLADFENAGADERSFDPSSAGA